MSREKGGSVMSESCTGRLSIGDNYGDNEATMRCQLPKGHKGPHQEKWSGFGSRRGLIFDAKLTWTQRKAQP